MRPDQPCIFFLTLPSLGLLLPRSLGCSKQAQLQLREQIVQSHNLCSPGEGSFSGRCRETHLPKTAKIYVLVMLIWVEVLILLGLYI